ncbi:hypothetical protein G7085_04920 [Tessaracoccus sp. HDW20]|nr:hypothetical protein [Tessaracoccus coleopterorum]NHB84185.1 hypothetical protein [Tessaracoccus coleopterorum]
MRPAAIDTGERWVLTSRSGPFIGHDFDEARSFEVGPAVVFTGPTL